MHYVRSSLRISAFAGTGAGTQSGQSKSRSQWLLRSRLRGNERRIRHAPINWKSYWRNGGRLQDQYFRYTHTRAGGMLVQMRSEASDLTRSGGRGMGE